MKKKKHGAKKFVSLFNMRERMIYVTCPHCGHVFQIKRDTISIAGMNSILDQRLDNGTHFTHVCQNCKEPFYMMYPFLYRDPQKSYCLILSNQKEFTNLPDDKQIIVCKSAAQFLLAYRICSQQLNFKLILQKVNLMQTKYKFAKFDCFDKENGCLWFEIGNEKKALLLNEKEVQQVVEFL